MLNNLNKKMVLNSGGVHRMWNVCTKSCLSIAMFQLLGNGGDGSVGVSKVRYVRVSEEAGLNDAQQQLDLDVQVLDGVGLDLAKVGVDNEVAIVGDDGARLSGRAGSQHRGLGAHLLEISNYLVVGVGHHLNGDTLDPHGAQSLGLFSVVGHHDKLAGTLGDNLFLEEACSSALDAVELRVGLVGAVKRHVQISVGVLVDASQSQPGVLDQLLALETRRNEHGVLGELLGQRRNLLGNVDHGGS